MPHALPTKVPRTPPGTSHGTIQPAGRDSSHSRPAARTLHAAPTGGRISNQQAAVPDAIHPVATHTQFGELPLQADGGLAAAGTPSTVREKESLRHTLEAIAREAADIQRELDGAAGPSLRARQNAAAALGRPLPPFVEQQPVTTSPAGAVKASRPSGSAAADGQALPHPGMDLGRVGHAVLGVGPSLAEPSTATPARGIDRVRRQAIICEVKSACISVPVRGANLPSA